MGKLLDDQSTVHWRGSLLASLWAHRSSRKPCKKMDVKNFKTSHFVGMRNGFGDTHQRGRGHGKAVRCCREAVQPLFIPLIGLQLHNSFCSSFRYSKKHDSIFLFGLICFGLYKWWKYTNPNQSKSDPLLTPQKDHNNPNIQKITGESPEVCFDKREPVWTLFEHQSASLSIKQHQ